LYNPVGAPPPPATGERLRSDTLEDLLAGVPIALGPREQTLKDADLERDRECLVIRSAIWSSGSWRPSVASPSGSWR
jgi:hypothetical protein